MVKKYKLVFFILVSFVLGVVLTDRFEKKTGYSLSKGELIAEIPIGEYGEVNLCKGCKGGFHFVLTARNESIRVYEEWNSWGWFARTFTAQDEEDPLSKYYIYRQRGTWDANYPSTYEIEAGKYLITDIDLCDRTWTIEPKLNEKRDHRLIMQGHFDVKPAKDDDLAKVNSGTFGLSWTGHLDTNKFKVVISKESASILNHPMDW